MDKPLEQTTQLLRVCAICQHEPDQRRNSEQDRGDEHRNGNLVHGRAFSLCARAATWRRVQASAPAIASSVTISPSGTWQSSASCTMAAMSGKVAAPERKASTATSSAAESTVG